MPGGGDDGGGGGGGGRGKGGENPEKEKSTSLPAMKPWNEVHKKALKRSLEFTCDNTTNITRICMLLIQKGIISPDERQEIEAFASDFKKMMELMRLMLKKSYKALLSFKEILIATGNDHVEEYIRGKEYAVLNNRNRNKSGSGTSESESSAEPEKPKKKKGKTKNGKKKLFSVYEPSDDEEDETPSKEAVEKLTEKIDVENPDVQSLLDYLYYVEQKLKLMMYYPQTLYRLSRFKSSPTEAVLPKEKYEPGMLKFKVNRAIFLKIIGFYGPATIPLTSYDVTIHVLLTNGKGEESIAFQSEIIECKIGEKMYMTFEHPVPIRPHYWHAIAFKIKGQERMAAQSDLNREQFLYLDYQVKHYDALRFEFDSGKEFQVGQIPELCFYRAKDRIPGEFFPKPPKYVEGDSNPAAAKYKANDPNVQQYQQEQLLTQSNQDTSCGCSIT